MRFIRYKFKNYNSRVCRILNLKHVENERRELEKMKIN